MVAVAAVTRALFDRLAKDLLGRALAPVGRVEPEQEIVSESQRADIAFEPGPGASFSERGILARMAIEPCLFEPFSSPVTEDEVRACLRKLLNQRSALRRRARKHAPPSRLWVLSGGRPRWFLETAEVEPAAGWPHGFYRFRGAPLYELIVVLLPEIPVDRDTLILRLMGRGRVFDRAIEDLQALPARAWERQVADGPIMELWLTISERKRKAGKLNKELRMAYELYEKWKRTELAEAKRQGLDEGRRQALRMAIQATYASRFQCELPVLLVDALEAQEDLDTLTHLVSVAATGNEQEIEASLVGAE